MATGLRMWLAILLLCMSRMAAADALTDPTRPPAEFFAAQTDAASGVKAVPTDDGLRTIIIAADHRSAVINGHVVPLGGKLDEERLISVCEDRVVLKGPEGRRVVSLYPDVDIHGGRAVRCNTLEVKSPQATSTPAKTSKKSHKVLDGTTGK